MRKTEPLPKRKPVPTRDRDMAQSSSDSDDNKPQKPKKPKTQAAASSSAAAASPQADPPRTLKRYDHVRVTAGGPEIGVVTALVSNGQVCVRFSDGDEDWFFDDDDDEATDDVINVNCKSFNPAELTYVGTYPVFRWLVAKPGRFNDVEIVQEEIAAGFKCAQVDLARLKSDFLTAWLEADDTPGPNGVRRLTLSPGTCTSRHVFVALFDSLISWGASRPEIDLDLADTIQLLHAADTIGCFHHANMHTHRYDIAINARLDNPPVPHPELLQIGMRYRMPDVIRACARWYKNNDEDLPSAAAKLACADYWRTGALADR